MLVSVKGRLERLERLQEPRQSDPELERLRWLASMRVTGAHDNHHRGEWSAGDIWRLLSKRGELEDLGFGAVLDRIMAWSPPPPRGAAERVLSRMAYEGEPGAEAMECPPEWRDAWEAADELRERHEAVPVEILARWLVAAHEAKTGGDPGPLLDAGEERNLYGIADELCRRAAGPDVEEVEDEEQERRLREILAGDYYGERAWEIQQEIYRLAGEGSP